MTIRPDSRARFFIKPTRLVAKEDARLAQALLEETEEVCQLPPGAWILLDFGRELHGGVRLDVPTTTPKGSPLVRVRFGESVSEAMGLPDQDHAIHDHLIRRANDNRLFNDRLVRVSVDLIDRSSIETLGLDTG